MKKILLSSILLLGVGVSMAQEKQAKADAPKKAEKSTKAMQTHEKSDPSELAPKQAAPVQVTYSDAIERAVPIQPKAGSKKEN